MNFKLMFLVTSALAAAWPAASQTSPKTFPSAAVACQSLFEAVQSGNEQSIVQILGEQPGVASSGDPAQDKSERELFVRKYQEMHRLHREADGSVVLFVGVENWPFPLRLVKAGGGWRFDADAGAKEILFRRIGENEMIAVEICREFAMPQQREEVGGRVVNALTEKARSTSKEPVEFHGYRFRVLSGQGTAPLLIAYPVEYRSSGVMTFVLAPAGKVFETDLGTRTPTAAKDMDSFHKDATWHEVVNPVAATK